MRLIKFDLCGVWIRKMLFLADKIGEANPNPNPHLRSGWPQDTPELADRYTEMLQI
jgi:hypothetical protein